MSDDTFPTIAFDALAAAGVLTVEVEFEGLGDVGQITSINTNTAAKTTHSGDLYALPFESRAMIVVLSDDGDLEMITFDNLGEVVEELIDDCLTEKHDGWENKGTFVLDVTKRRIRYDRDRTTGE